MAPRTNADPETGEMAETFGDDLDRPDEDDYRSLLDQTNREITGWQPQPGDKVYGVVVDIGDAESEYGEYTLVVIDSPEYLPLVGLHCFHTVLRNAVQTQIKRGNLVIGSKIAVNYKGEQSSTKAGRSDMHVYTIAVRPPVRP